MKTEDEAPPKPSPAQREWIRYHKTIRNRWIEGTLVGLAGALLSLSAALSAIGFFTREAEVSEQIDLSWIGFAVSKIDVTAFLVTYKLQTTSICGLAAFVAYMWSRRGDIFHLNQIGQLLVVSIGGASFPAAIALLLFPFLGKVELLTEYGEFIVWAGMMMLVVSVVIVRDALKPPPE